MAHKFAEIAFTPTVRELQRASGSREGYAAMDGGEDYNYLLGEREAAFIAARDSLYMASVSESGWPYIQHRGGPAGFMKVLDERTIGFADYSGNRQYVSTGNVLQDDRVALFFMDYPNRRRLKLLGRVEIIGIDDERRLAQLEDPDYRARIERGFIITVEAFDWNCPQHITPRFTASEVEAVVNSLREQNRELKARLSNMGHTKAHPAALRSGAHAAPVVLGEGPLELVITGVRQLTPGVRAYELRDPAGGLLPAVTAGSHLRVPARLANGELVERYYSLASNPARRDAYEIAVQCHQEGAGGSRAVHDTYGIGATLRVDMPANHFELHDDARPAILLAGGIGITAIKPMAQALQERGANFHLHYAGRNRREMAFLDRLQRQFKAQLTVYSSAEGERMDIGLLLAQAAADAVIYVCGPDRMIDAAVDAARNIGMPSDRLRFERFV